MIGRAVEALEGGNIAKALLKTIVLHVSIATQGLKAIGHGVVGMLDDASRAASAQRSRTDVSMVANGSAA